MYVSKYIYSLKNSVMKHTIEQILFELTGEIVEVYEMKGITYLRSKSKLKGERVKTAEEFRNTMRSAQRLADSSPIGSDIYRSQEPGPARVRFQQIVGQVIRLIKAGIAPLDIILQL